MLANRCIEHSAGSRDFVRHSHRLITTGAKIALLATFDLLADHPWDSAGRRLQATAWAAQYAAWSWLQDGKPCPGPKRCAACAAEIDEAPPKTRCSTCLLVGRLFWYMSSPRPGALDEQHHAGVLLQQASQIKAHPIHKYNCLKPSLRQYAGTLKVKSLMALHSVVIACNTPIELCQAIYQPRLSCRRCVIEP